MYEPWIEFVKNLYHPKEVIPLHEPVFAGREKEVIADCIDSTFVSSVGEYVNKVEDKLAKQVGVEHAVMVVNGTAALHVSLLCAGVEPHDEVITQPLTFIATCNAIKYCGAYPVFIDVDSDTLGMSPEALERFIQADTFVNQGELYNKHTQRKISAVVPMHTFGHPCRIDDIQRICAQYGLKLIEDNAEALGSRYKKKSAGTYGLLSSVSFNGNKIITAGGGGAILTNDKQLADLAKHLTTTAKTPHPWHIAHDAVGFNYRMPNLNAALLWAQLEHFPSILENKRWIAKQYEQFFQTVDWAEFIKEPHDAESNYWLNTIQLENLAARDKFLEITNAQGIITRPPWALMPDLPMYASAYCADISQSRTLSETLVNLPSGARLS